MPDPKASLAAAQAAGLATPQPSDFIHRGDDAITLNARFTADALELAGAAATRAELAAGNEATLQAAITAPSLAKVEELSSDEFGVRFTDGDYFVRANERDGITSRVGGSFLEPLDPSTGFVWAVAFRDPATGETRVDFGRRTDGTLYDATRDGTTTPEAGSTLPAPVIVWGDSLAAGWAPTIGATLAPALGVSVTVLGRGGQVSGQIAARQGGEPTRVTLPGNTVPADTTPVAITMSPNLGTGAANGGTYPGAIVGIAGTITVASDGSATFTRAEAGRARPAPAGSPFITGTQYREHLPLIISGRNNYGDPAAVVAHTRAMLAYSHRGADALVVSVLPWDSDTTGTAARDKLNAANAALQNAFPTQYIDWGAYLRSEATLASVGITPTATDVQNIADGVTPLSFRKDGGHLNDIAYRAVTDLITDHYRTRGLL